MSETRAIPHEHEHDHGSGLHHHGPVLELPPVERAWSAKRGETVFLRLPDRTTPEAFQAARETADRATAETGVYFVLLAHGVDIVALEGAEYPDPTARSARSQ